MVLTLRQLEVFAAVCAADGSVTEAASSLFVSQPSVSDTLSSLQNEIGAAVFVGRGRARRLSPAGEILLRHATRLFDELTTARQEIADLADELSGHVDVLAVPTAGENFVPKALNEFTRSFPAVEVALRVANRAAALEILASGGIDLVIMGRPPSGIGNYRELMPNRLIAVSSPRSFVGRVDANALLDETFLVRENGSGTRLTVEQALNERGLRFGRTMVLGSNAAVIAGLRQGLGVSVLPEIAVAEWLDRGEIQPFGLPGFPLLSAWFALWPGGRPPSNPTLALLDALAADVVTEPTRSGREAGP